MEYKPASLDNTKPASQKLERVIERLGKGALLNVLPELRQIKDEVEGLESSVRFDELTGTYNLRSFVPEVTQSVSLINRLGGLSFGLGLVDVDNFKKLNDSHGHDFGDEVLKTEVKRMRLALRSSDKIFRIGGDEFVVYFDAIDDAGDIDQSRLSELEAVLCTPICYHGRFIDIGVSLGYSRAESLELRRVAHASPETAAQTLNAIKMRADKAMYSAKRR